MPVLMLLLAALTLLGHAALWVGIVNRWHSTGYPRKVVKSVTLVFYAALVAPVLGAAWYFYESSWRILDVSQLPLNGLTAYLAFCAAYGAAHLPLWAIARVRSLRHLAAVEHQQTQLVDIRQRLGAAPASGLRTLAFSRLPLNELWKLHVCEFQVQLPGLPAELNGLSIIHWSDLHISGRIDKGYYREVAEITGELGGDLIALTGDICDTARHFDWLGETLGQVQARLGKFFILGNHDLRTRDMDGLRRSMVSAGFTDLGGRWQKCEHAPILIAGNEWPWIKSNFNLSEVPRPKNNELRLLLAHSPDQFGWARHARFDLMLAGHTHGGQIRFPIVGPVLCPSRHGVKYSAGFYQEGPTLLHVSRGTASLMPYRLNCPPEITKLVLVRAT